MCTHKCQNHDFVFYENSLQYNIYIQDLFFKILKTSFCHYALISSIMPSRLTHFGLDDAIHYALISSIMPSRLAHFGLDDAIQNLL